MFPYPIVYYINNMSRSNTKYFRKIKRRNSIPVIGRITSTNNSYLQFIEFCFWVVNAKKLRPVSFSIVRILFLSSPIQILNRVIGFSINAVTANHANWSRRNKCNKNELVYFLIKLFSVFTESDICVFAIIKMLSKFFKKFSSLCRINISFFIGEIIWKIRNGFNHNISKIKKGCFNAVTCSDTLWRNLTANPQPKIVLC